MDFNKMEYLKYLHINFSQLSIYPGIICIDFCHIEFSGKHFKISQISIKEDLNIFRQIKISEPEHSLILANLLNPNGTHGCKDVFLKLFFNILVPELNIEENDKWFVTAEIGHYDIRIRNQNNSKIIIIENKSNNANDRENLLYRYWFNGIYSTIQQKIIRTKMFFKNIIFKSC
jgi:hypothetical protein